MNNQSPFLDIRSFVTEEMNSETYETSIPTSSPFVSLYETDGDMVDPRSEEYVTFLSELYDEEFNYAISNLIDEATALYEANFSYELEDPQVVGYRAERLLNQHFSPLVAEAEAMFDALSREFSQRDVNSLSDDETEATIDRYHATSEFGPNFEELFGRLKKMVKKAASTAVKLAKKGVSVAATLGLGPILEKLKALVKPLLNRVINMAIGKLPISLQPFAKKLAEKLPFLKELEADYESGMDSVAGAYAAEIQYEFNQQVANLLFAESEVEQDLEIARVISEQPEPDAYPLAELDRARADLIANLQGLREGEDVAPYIENFIPAVLPALKIGLKLVGRKRVVDFLAKLIAKLIQKFIGPQHALALSRAIVDVGLRLIHLEAMPEDESRAAASAVAATVEETVRRVAALPDYVLDDQELLEGFTLEAFEQAAAANLPAVLPAEIYRKRPELAESHKFKGVWVTMPHGRRKRFKKYSRQIRTSLTPRKVAELESYEGIPVEYYLEEALGLAPGEETEALVHLYEAIPGTRLSQIVRHDETLQRLGAAYEHAPLHPLTRQAAVLLTGEPDLGREDASGLQTGQIGERYYFLEIPGKRPLTIPGPAGSTKVRRVTRIWLDFHFPQNLARVHLFLSEVRAQEIAVKLRQKAHTGSVSARLNRIIERGLRTALNGRSRRLKIAHAAVPPGQWANALQRLPSISRQVLHAKLTEWVVKAMATHLKQRPEEFLKAAEDTADGVTLIITLENPPGFSQLREALKSRTISLDSLKMEGAPKASIKIIPGYQHE